MYIYIGDLVYYTVSMNSEIKGPDILDIMPVETISFQPVSGLPKTYFEPHDTGWRKFPYTVIVGAFDSIYTCEIESNGVYSIKSGEVLIVPGGLTHRMSFAKPGYLNCLHIKFTVLNGMDALSFYDVPFTLKCTPERPFAELVDKISGYLNDEDRTLKKAAGMKAGAFRLFEAILDNSVEKEDAISRFSSIGRLLPVLEHIWGNMDKNITRKTLAEILSLSETRFHYVFKEAMGVPPMKYLKEERLRKAYLLILTTNNSLNEISMAIGYADYTNFTKQFKAHFGETPRDIRGRRKATLTTPF